MKRSYTFAGVIGGLLILIFSGIIIHQLNTPTDLFNVSIALYTQSAAYIAFGVFLVFIYLKGKSQTEALVAPTPAEPDSPEDIERLHKARNKILGFVLLVEIIGSIPPWILNDYTAGVTIVNLVIIWDVLLNVILLGVAILLFRNKKGAERILLYTASLYLIVSAVLVYFVPNLGMLVSSLLMLAYFMASILVPLNRKNFRITQVILLPAVMILMSATPILSNAKLDKLSRELSLQLVQYTADKTQTSDDLKLFLQSQNPTSTLIKNIKNDLEAKDKQVELVLSALRTMQIEYAKQLPSIFQQQQMSLIKKEIDLIDLTKQEDEIANQLMDYASTVDFAHITSKQAAEMNDMVQQIAALDKQMQIAAYKIDNPI